MSKSKIEWTDETDNVIVVEGDDGQPNGWYCEKVSEGCQHCYAERLNHTPFYGGNGLAYSKRKEGPPKLLLRRDILESWTRATKPKRRFVNSMTDTFGEFVPEWWVDDILQAARDASTQTFQFLTKRPGRMKGMVSRWLKRRGLKWLPENIQLGVSVENQEWANHRLPALIKTPAVVKFVSLEPLLGPVDISIWLHTGWTKPPFDDVVNWVIVGGESGPNARPMHPDWVRSIRDQCKAAEVPLFFKQWGEWSPAFQDAGEWYGHPQLHIDDYWFSKVGKKRAGRLLDGREWNEFPGGNYG